ncbi:3-beta-hydroxy-delta(5)-steroid dehydrogenase [Sinorhizobium fredii USDA 205]|uniref:Complex I NDUFA9 subunit family protein n=3 Tax=Rhizobium fredii TaxID=380 RepID=A0A2A6M1Y2_RHIFR|nr:complex I NDUFA9 subunit family protein [Sinorhizobium fredii]ASY71317.1 NADH-ubiquinone oxidoreductase 39 kD subunit [Sinorhizobium fredii CCBAU 83666]KSV87765.1 3-beta-hydroxy-delta(5)-steroid dehydrogenase [Sinorhizobium fredii USDA 205]MCG5475918.1 complex I NDUFA9 subunit family protein [Sinorhizobium fredii]MQW97312.1 NAD-dependent epimerase/dehydratase family protein [Sinorhizobium fredii]MQX07954.1 NAD-dependent epimerase/dehydratase family protein [Sinorhizobium fredii]
MTLSNLPPLVTIFGGSGFVGRHVVRALAKRGYRIRVAVRRPDLAGHLQPLGSMGQISFVQANLRYRKSVDRAVEGADHVINCVGVLFESGRNTFDAVQDFGARAVAEAARAAGATLTHISAIGADTQSASSYARTKGRAEIAILETVPEAVILRPSIIFGPEDDFFNKFASMARFAPALPLIGGGQTKFQPVYVTDVAEAVARTVDGKLKGGTIYELGGAQVLSFRECLEITLKTIDRKRSFVSIPFGIASLLGSVASLVPFIAPPITADQVVLLKSDNVVSAAAEAEGRTLAGIGIEPTLLDSILPTYLVRFRPQGQYTRGGGAA